MGAVPLDAPSSLPGSPQFGLYKAQVHEKHVLYYLRAIYLRWSRSALSSFTIEATKCSFNPARACEHHKLISLLRDAGLPKSNKLLEKMKGCICNAIECKCCINVPYDVAITAKLPSMTDAPPAILVSIDSKPCHCSIRPARNVYRIHLSQIAFNAVKPY